MRWGAMEVECDYDSRDEQERYEEREYPTFTPEERAASRARRERDAWADAHLAAEKAVATWWRLPALISNYYADYADDDELVRGGALMEQNPAGTLEDAPYLVGGTYSTIQEDGTRTITT
jgi:hypothetical protein